MSKRFESRTAIVTGASRGIGLAIAGRLVADGARMVITARTQEALEEAVTQLGGADHALGVAGRADDNDHQAEVVERAIGTFGSVDLLVNNAGINPAYGPMMQLDLAVARKVVEVNCISALSWVQQAYKAWMQKDAGAIVNICSIARHPGGAQHRLLRSEQSDAHPYHPDARDGAWAGHPCQRGRTGRGQDQVRHRSLRGPRGAGGRAVPPQAAG
jgi:NAD(P)-dependent dehydrogenase (short-subunit alcohol dehydrogenase family)